MRKILFTTLLLIFPLFFLAGCAASNRQIAPLNVPLNNPNHMIKITSPTYNEGGFIPAKYACDGQNINPPLSISQIPAAAKSLVLILDDPDAPRGTWTHWIVFNIDPQTAEIAENSLPAGAKLGKNDYGKDKYSGPCPPSGVHRYIFHVYALDTILNLSDDAALDAVRSAMDGHILDSAELLGKYQRK